MLNPILNPIMIVARKEVTDSLRDKRSVISSLMYALMGPVAYSWSPWRCAWMAC